MQATGHLKGRTWRALPHRTFQFIRVHALSLSPITSICFFIATTNFSVQSIFSTSRRLIESAIGLNEG
ncbi:hypothetical protein Syun_004810 [Stephania yunnanensis]|uniref:Uncharacterized protein n=1 Tax=Stephania yunnanensis TaxID=152371 RepID=A0AAP0L556_9MAGN